MRSKPEKPQKCDEVSGADFESAGNFDFKLSASYRQAINEQPVDSPYRKFLERYNSMFKRAEAEADCSQKRAELTGELNYLKSLAEDGDVLGLRMLAFLATEATKRLNDLADRNPEFAAVAAENMPLWPILVSQRSARDVALKEFLEGIRLDKGMPLGVPSVLIGSEPVESKDWALSLLQALQAARQDQDFGKSCRSSWGFQLKPIESLDLIFGLPVGNELMELLKKLPPLHPVTIKLWWKIAGRILRLTMTHRPELVKGLILKYGQTDRVKNAVSQGDKTAGIVQSEVVEEVKKAFYRLAIGVRPKIKN